MRTLSITAGVGEGDTKIAAFDAALLNAGIANYNLIRLSSIIPPDTELVRRKPDTIPEEFGHKLYVVYASEIRDQVGEEAWAGVGWTLAEGGNGKGLFTEHEADSREEVARLIQDTLANMVAARPEQYGPVDQEITGIRCEGKPVCALVAAVYAAEGWEGGVSS